MPRGAGKAARTSGGAAKAAVRGRTATRSEVADDVSSIARRERATISDRRGGLAAASLSQRRRVAARDGHRPAVHTTGGGSEDVADCVGGRQDELAFTYGVVAVAAPGGWRRLASSS